MNSKRILLLSLLLTLTVFTVSAIRPLPRPVLYTQPDGTTISVMRHGDGRTAFYTTSDGLTLVRDTTVGGLCHARIENGRLVSSHLVAHESGQGGA